MAYLIGIDLGGTKIHTALTTKEGVILKEGGDISVTYVRNSEVEHPPDISI